jgi:hypothetical protein
VGVGVEVTHIGTQCIGNHHRQHHSNTEHYTAADSSNSQCVAAVSVWQQHSHVHRQQQLDCRRSQEQALICRRVIFNHMNLIRQMISNLLHVTASYMAALFRLCCHCVLWRGKGDGCCWNDRTTSGWASFWGARLRSRSLVCAELVRCVGHTQVCRAHAPDHPF